MKPITQTSNTINTRTFSTQALRRISTATPEAFMRTTNDYVNARAKERNTIRCNTKRTPATFEERADLNTPPAISDHVRELAPFLKNCNETTAHATTAKALINHIPALMPEHPAPLWVLAAAPVAGKEHGRIYYANSNTNRADKPAFREDWLYLFDSLSEDYSA